MLPTTRRRALIGLAASLLLLAGTVPAALAANPPIVVTSTIDAVDKTPGNGVCETDTGNGVCTLRAAVMEANAFAGADVIELAADTYTLTIPGRAEYSATKGDLNARQELTIVGKGAGATIVQASAVDHTTAVDRIFDVRVDGTVLTLTGMTIRHGDGGGAQGGAISVPGPAQSLVLDGVELTGNHAPGNGGGAISYGTLTISNSRFSDNHAHVAGAIASYGPPTVTTTAFVGNSGHSAAVRVAYPATSATIRSSTFTGNTTATEASALQIGTGGMSEAT